MFYSNEIVQTSRNSSFDPLLNPVCASGTHLPRCLHKDRGGVGRDVLVTRVAHSGVLPPAVHVVPGLLNLGRAGHAGLS